MLHQEVHEQPLVESVQVHPEPSTSWWSRNAKLYKDAFGSYTSGFVHGCLTGILITAFVYRRM